MNTCLAGLADAIGLLAKTDGDHATALDGLTVHRRSQPTEPLHCIYSLSLVVLARGAKKMLLGTSERVCAAGQSMLTTVDLPVISHVTLASAREPFLAVLLALDSGLIAESVAEMDQVGRPDSSSYRPLSIEQADPHIVDGLYRLLGLVDQPDVVHHLAPLIHKELVVRLLSGAHGPELRHRVAAGSVGQRVATAVSWLKRNYTQSFPMDDLANRAHMSPSTFRQHFRRITGTSPLQYQKQLRLQEARHLLLDGQIDARQAAGRVGYESESQFSREYRRFFGAPPIEHVSQMLAQATAPLG